MVCKVDGCSRMSSSRGWCKMHYERWRRINHPITVICSIEGCKKLTRICGLCSMHYARIRKHGTIELPVRVPKVRGVCSVEGCINELSYRSARGLCVKHYQRLRKRGTINDPIRTPWPTNCVIQGCNGQVAVKEFSLCWRHYQHHWQGRLGQVKEKESHGLHKTSEYQSWRSLKDRCLNKNNDSYIHYGGRNIVPCYRWRESFTAFYKDMGKRPEGTSIDRINNDGGYWCGKCEECIANGWVANCRWADDVTQRLNQRMRITNKSGYKNVNWDKSRNLWAVRIKRHKKYVFGGRFATIEEAIAARDNFLLQYEDGN